MSISQVSETLFILAILFLKRFGIKQVMLFRCLLGCCVWTVCLWYPGDGLWMIIMSCVVYGMAFDFFNISGSLFIETTTDFRIRSALRDCL
jgi:NHS family xanthosine MFS transporter